MTVYSIEVKNSILTRNSSKLYLTVGDYGDFSYPFSLGPLGKREGLFLVRKE